MNVPGFSANDSLYATSAHYRVSGSELVASSTTEPVVPAYFPGPATQRACSTCLSHCARNNAICNTLAIGTIWNPLLAAAAYELCFSEALRCAALCTLPGLGWIDGSDCCPKVCDFPNPFNPGEGCCDENEHCVDRFDPNSRHGCCPSDQNVCGGNCCAKGDSCCGGDCCPPNFFCIDNVCKEFPGPLLPPKSVPSTKLPPHLWYCPWGSTPCNGKCCGRGLECCPDGECKWTCVH
jgi:hypothetical protein